MMKMSLGGDVIAATRTTSACGCSDYIPHKGRGFGQLRPPEKRGNSNSLSTKSIRAIGCTQTPKLDISLQPAAG